MKVSSGHGRSWQAAGLPTGAHACTSTSADWNYGWDIAVALNAMGKAVTIAECAALVMEQFRCVTIACI